MKRNARLALPLLLFCLLLSACGSGAGGDSLPSSGEAQSAPSSAPYEPGESGGASMDAVYSESVSLPSAGSGALAREDAKIIRTASLYLQTTEFDEAAAALDRLTEEQGGYFQSAAQDSGSYYSGSTSRYGHYTVRVPKEHFNSFLSAVGEVAHVVSRTVDSQNVGEEYYDAELRLATLETKHERLLALLDQADVMEDIITLETALSDVEYEIQQYTSTLDRYDGLIDFSTITIELQEVARVTSSAGETDGLGVRLSSAFSKGWANFCDGAANFIVWVALHFVGCLIFAAVVVAVIVIVKKRFFPAKSKSQSPPAPPADPKQ